MATILDLPYQNIVDRESRPKSEGFDVVEIKYGSKVSQRSLNGPSVEASRLETWTVVWKGLSKDVDGQGVDYDIDLIRQFYRQAQLSFVRWKPFEYDSPRIWRIIPNTLSVKNPSGTNFEASLDLEYVYSE